MVTFRTEQHQMAIKNLILTKIGIKIRITKTATIPINQAMQSQETNLTKTVITTDQTTIKMLGTKIEINVEMSPLLMKR